MCSESLSGLEVSKLVIKEEKNVQPSFGAGSEGEIILLEIGFKK